MKISQFKKQYLFIIIAVILVGVVSTVIQIATAGVTGPHIPGHPWATIDKPPDCTTGYAYGASDSGWLCGIPTDTDTWITTQTCATGEYLSSVGKTTKTCSTPTGTNYWTLSGSDVYPNSTSYNVAIGTTGAAGYKLNVYGHTRVIGGDITITSYGGTGGSLCLGGTCKSSWPSLYCVRSYSDSSATGWVTASVSCSSSYKATGGGLEAVTQTITDTGYSRPNSGATGWECRAYSAFTGSWTLRCWVMCCMAY